MRRLILLAGLIAPALLNVPASAGEPVIWGIQMEQLEYRLNGGPGVAAWDFDALIGTDEVRAVWRSEAEFAFEENEFETLENQLRVQTPISDFFDAVAGVRFDTPAGPDRVFGVIGLHGLAPQFVEVDLDFFVSQHPAMRFEAEYEGLITNRIILTPSIEFELPFTDDEDVGVGAFGPKLEVGARLSYDLIDRAFAPYIGVHYERVFGNSAVIAKDEGENVDDLFFVLGARLMY